jgi:transcriptional regulator GlxA family with amidase domain
MSRKRIVRLAEERFEAAGDASVSLVDLCIAAGVSARTLQYAFREYYGLSPTAYFRMRRFNRARHSLRNAAPDRGAVKRAALDAGITELGRFSVEYRRLFGESPSVTLSRAAG